jgi:hypothetical protein
LGSSGTEKIKQNNLADDEVMKRGGALKGDIWFN